MQFIEYPKCSTCQKAKKYLDANGISYQDRMIKEETPTVKELTDWINKYQIEIKKLFNTSGLKYKELSLKEKLPDMSEKEKIKLLASDGMLIKRPLLVMEDKILIGFKEKEYQQELIDKSTR